MASRSLPHQARQSAVVPGVGVVGGFGRQPAERQGGGGEVGVVPLAQGAIPPRTLRLSMRLPESIGLASRQGQIGSGLERLHRLAGGRESGSIRRARCQVPQAASGRWDIRWFQPSWIRASVGSVDVVEAMSLRSRRGRACDPRSVTYRPGTMIRDLSPRRAPGVRAGCPDRRSRSRSLGGGFRGPDLSLRGRDPEVAGGRGDLRPVPPEELLEGPRIELDLVGAIGERGHPDQPQLDQAGRQDRCRLLVVLVAVEHHGQIGDPVLGVVEGGPYVDLLHVPERRRAPRWPGASAARPRRTQSRAASRSPLRNAPLERSP